MLRRMNPSGATPMATGIGPEGFSESEAFYRAALESLSEGVMILGAECRIIYANKLVYEITGYSAEELLGQTPHLLRADSEKDDCAADKASDEEPRCFEFEMKRKDGRLHWMSVKSTP